MNLYLTYLFELFFFPPGMFIFFLLLSVFLINNLKQLKNLIILQVLLIYFLTIPATNYYLFSILETTPAITPKQLKDSKADVIIVLAGGIKTYKKEYHGPDIGYFTQLRLRYAAWLQKRTHLPILVTGGIKRGEITEAELMKRVLKNEYMVASDTIFIEKESQNTYENSFYSSKIMLEQQFQNYYLVTSAFHMPRAMMAFKKHNNNIIPAPTGFYHNTMDYFLGDFIPNSKSLWQNYLALHEIIGFYWYKLRY